LVLLDAFFEVFLWIGSKSKEQDKKVAMETALEYLHKIREERPPNMKVTNLKESGETLTFVSNFHGWSRLFHTNVSVSSASDDLLEYSKIYTLSQLQSKESLPSSVDRTCLENYLSDDEFRTVFNMDKYAFGKLPLWKQAPLKKKAGLY